MQYVDICNWSKYVRHDVAENMNAACGYLKLIHMFQLFLHIFLDVDICTWCKFAIQYVAEKLNSE